MSGSGKERTETQQRRNGGQILVDQLLRLGADIAFCVPGESFLPVLDALYCSPIRLISCRHEASAANMADAYGKLTGRPGLCLVSRGPGATHASIGLHTAAQDSTPLVLLIGDVPSHDRDREAFQEMDYHQFFGGLAKWVGVISGPSRIPEYVARAYATAVSGRPGPVVLVLPEEMLYAETTAASVRPFAMPQAGPADTGELAAVLTATKRPLAIVGGSGWSAEVSEDLRCFLEGNSIPACSAFRRQDAISHESPAYVGELGFSANPKLAERVRASDLLLVIGGRLDEQTTAGYTLLVPPWPEQRLVHVHPAPDELAGVYKPSLPIVSAPEPFARAVRELRLSAPAWTSWADQARQEYLQWSTPPSSTSLTDEVDLAAAISLLQLRLPADAIVCNGAGNFSGWIHRYWRFRSFPSQLAPTSGAMGYGIPAALAAKAVHPDRTVICIAGDGDFLMSGQELATAVQYELPILVVVVNNGMYGTIRMHQERNFPGRVIATDLVNPDFAAYARAFGIHGETVVRTAELDAAIGRALEANGSALIELRVDSDLITPRSRLSEIQADALRAQSA